MGKRLQRKERMKRRTEIFLENQFSDGDSFIRTKPSDSILLNKESLVDSTNILKKNVGLMKDTNIWHAFILRKVSTMTMKTTLKTLMNFLKPADIIPVHFKCIGEDCLFLSISCEEAVFTLWRNDFEIPNPMHPTNPIQCEIILRYSSVKLISFDLVKKKYFTYLMKLMIGDELNLENFAGKEMPHYWPLSQPRILHIVLDLSKNIQPTCIKLNNNEIENLLPLVVLWDTNVTKLDLRNNLINKISQLEALKMMNLLELWLDGNPLCNQFDEFTYVKIVKDIFPNLHLLDGIPIRNNVGPVYRRNFLCDTEGFDIVNQFLEFYFPLYDSYRNLLIDLYHRNATFSLTSSYIANQETSNTAKLFYYNINSRNLLHLANFKNPDLLIRGAHNILKKLLELPKSEHDSNSFTVDLIYHKSNTCVISITGVFQELRDQSSERKPCLLGFNRTFSLRASNGEFTIINDLMHVYNALTYQVQTSFKVRNPSTTTCIAKTDSDKVKAIEAIQLATGLKEEWAKRLFVDSKNDLVKCLRNFMADVKVDKIPADAFENGNEIKEIGCTM